MVPVVTIDDVKDDKDGGVDESESGDRRHGDKQRQRSSQHIIRLNARRHHQLYHTGCQSLTVHADQTNTSDCTVKYNTYIMHLYLCEAMRNAHIKTTTRKNRNSINK